MNDLLSPEPPALYHHHHQDLDLPKAHDIHPRTLPHQRSNQADTSKKRRRGNLPKEVTEFLKAWLVDHKKHPYPSEKEKIQLANRTGLTVNQISNWFINARRRILQPMLESESINAHLMACNETATLEQKKRRQLDIYTYHGFAGETKPPILLLCKPTIHSLVALFRHVSERKPSMGISPYQTAGIRHCGKRSLLARYAVIVHYLAQSWFRSLMTLTFSQSAFARRLPL